MRCASNETPLTPETAVEPPRLAAILETALYAPDLDAAEAFYGGVLGLERATRAGNRHVFFRLGNAMLLIFNPAETERPPHDPALPVPAARRPRPRPHRLRRHRRRSSTAGAGT